MDGVVEATEPQPQLSARHVEFIKALRDLADFYEQRPQVLLPCIDTMSAFPSASALPSIARAIGACEKDVLADSWFIMRKRFGPIKLEFSWQRDSVCERVVVGRETVEEKVPVAYEVRKVEKDKVEWHCPKVLAPRLPKPQSTGSSDEEVLF